MEITAWCLVRLSSRSANPDGVALSSPGTTSRPGRVTRWNVRAASESGRPGMSRSRSSTTAPAGQLAASVRSTPGIAMLRAPGGPRLARCRLRPGRLTGDPARVRPATVATRRRRAAASTAPLVWTRSATKGSGIAAGEHGLDLRPPDRSQPLAGGQLAAPRPDERGLEIVAPVDPLHAAKTLLERSREGLAKRVAVGRHEELDAAHLGNRRPARRSPDVRLDDHEPAGPLVGLGLDVAQAAVANARRRGPWRSPRPPGSGPPRPGSSCRCRAATGGAFGRRTRRVGSRSGRSRC